ncbi:MAG: hydrogenase subunit MbhD domain-containing protein [Lamprobacter sp.]|uniref:hydrogenase subunit MbhD domain-containing protein n=1 Tax=Lamprobacter sp. TaxID=3100796 RepID=UPI002B261B5A|nr:hydrogenase subunit MbhD domain-containing protein [Lamprobacter sp.]MEA3638871.1 hydrogenase subunit MbhD domain-containing protein [Lamprobacter sp.]
MAGLSLLPLAIDLVLALTLLWLAWRSLTSPELFRAVVLFIALGLVLGLVWVRLDAIDIALAEIALGAGVTGALLLAALAKLQATDAETAETLRRQGASDPSGRGNSQSAQSATVDEARDVAPIAWRLLLALLLLLPLIGLSILVWELWVPAPGLADLVDARLDESGVSYAVTAVLLNFRGYDTLFELAVLLLALIGVWSLSTAPHLGADDSDPALASLSRLLAPLMILVAAYLVWVGAHAPGGAFQAGSVLGAAGVLLRLSGWRVSTSATGWPLRLVLVLGVAVFALIGLAVMTVGQPLLGYPPEWAKTAILSIELAATLSIGAILAALFIGGRP